jgi:rfaE bifunctional protein nucleotidyltransferase chain/domain
MRSWRLSIMPADERFGALMEARSAAVWREQQRSSGRRVVFTNGVFDVLHAGHVEYLAWARDQGDALIVGLNSDASVRAIKGERRPIVPFADRATVLRALRSVDVVVGFEERTPAELLELLRPDIHVKSAQYREEELPERDVVLRHGGEIRLAPHIAGHSSTDIIGDILRRYRTQGS